MALGELCFFFLSRFGMNVDVDVDVDVNVCL